MPRIAKQLIILLVFLLIMGGIGYGIYSIFRVKPTCSDGIQNQGEEGIDCGVAVCGVLCPPATVPLSVEKNVLLSTGDSTFDFVAVVRNQNNTLGSGTVSYSILFTDASGAQVAQQDGTFYILPNQTRYIVRPALVVSGHPTDAKLVIHEVTWERMNALDVPIDFSVLNTTYQDHRASGARLDAIVRNNSDFDFDTVDIAVVLSDENGEIIGINQTTVNTLLSKEQRAFSVQWPFAISTSSPNVAVSVTTDAFANGNFIKRYGTQEKFQEFYPQP